VGKLIQIEYYTGGPRVAAKVLGPKYSSRILMRARSVAGAYALMSANEWWSKTVDESWRALPTRYDRFCSYHARLHRRILKVLIAKGMTK